MLSASDLSVFAIENAVDLGLSPVLFFCSEEPVTTRVDTLAHDRGTSVSIEPSDQHSDVSQYGADGNDAQYAYNEVWECQRQRPFSSSGM